jgi:hypothetical protein
LRNFIRVLDFGRIISTLTHKIINLENDSYFSETCFKEPPGLIAGIGVFGKGRV